MLELYQPDTLISVTKSISEILMLPELFFLSCSVINSQKKFISRNLLPSGHYQSATEFAEKNVRTHLWFQKQALLENSLVTLRM
jgi:hypothetical protein